MPTDFHVHGFVPGDTLELYKIFYFAVYLLTANEYTQAQRNAWALSQFEHHTWQARFMANNPFLVECRLGGVQQIAGFADLQASGYVDMFYVSHCSPRPGSQVC